MDLQHLPLLEVQRDVYRLPRGMDRFRQYIATMTGGTSDIALPLGSMNPMGKDHIPALLDQYLALDAEGAAADAVADARRRLAEVEGALRVALVVADDLLGGWTDRANVDHKHRFERRAEVKRGFATALLWTSEPATLADVGPRVLASVHRSAQALLGGDPKTLGECMRREGLALRFAGVEAGPVDAGARRILAGHRDRTNFATIFACLWGDKEAERSGHKPLGVPAGAAFSMAIEDCEEDPIGVFSSL